MGMARYDFTVKKSASKSDWKNHHDDPPPWLEPLRSSLCRLSAFKKACPFEFKRHVRLQADTEFGHLFCRISVSQCEFNEGAFRLSGGGGHATCKCMVTVSLCDFADAN